MSMRWGLALLAMACVACGGDTTSPNNPSGGGATRITLTAPHPTLAAGESQQLSVVLTGPDGVGHAPEGPVVWRSSNEAIYTVWSGGLAVAVAAGQATITVTADGRTAETLLRVDAAAGALRHLQGRVLDFASQAGLPGVTVGFGVNFPDVTFQTVTDGSGAFAIDVPAGDLVAYTDGTFTGTLAVHVGGPAYRADLLGNGGACVSRYGVVTDAQTFQPVAGATVSLGGKTMVTGPDGWYRLDFDCAGPIGFNTTFITVTHAGHQTFNRVVGRGIAFVNRLDAELQR